MCGANCPSPSVSRTWRNRATRSLTTSLRTPSCSQISFGRSIFFESVLRYRNHSSFSLKHKNNGYCVTISPSNNRNFAKLLRKFCSCSIKRGQQSYDGNFATIQSCYGNFGVARLIVGKNTMLQWEFHSCSINRGQKYNVTMGISQLLD